MISQSLPVSFKDHGYITYGILKPVHGGGANLFHLMVGNHYVGQLNWSPMYGWIFTSNYRENLADQAELLGEHVAVALESQEVSFYEIFSSFSPAKI